MSYQESAELYDAIYAARKSYQNEANVVASIIEAWKQTDDKGLLDVGCGTGLHGQYLRAIYDFEGLDASSEMLACARRRLPEVPLHRGDMIDFDLGRKFGAVITLFSAVGHLTTREQLGAAINTMARHLVPGGVLLIEPWYLRGRWRPGKQEINVFPRARILRLVRAKEEDGLAVLEMHYLVGWPLRPRYLFVRHRLGLFTGAEYGDALADANLEHYFDEVGLTRRGLFIARAPC